MKDRSRPSAVTPTVHVSVCGRCGTSGQLRESHPWCGPCGHYLVWDTAHRDWTSYAEREYRQLAAESARQIAASAVSVQAAAAALRDQIPDGWTVAPAQHLPGAPHTLDVHPTPGPVDAMAYLAPRDGQGGWLVRIHNRTSRIDFPLYVPGGARAALYPTPKTALLAAINALRIELAASTGR